MRRHLILTLAIMIALTTILSAPIGSGPTPACAKTQFEQPEKTFDGDPEYFDGGQKPSQTRSQVLDLPTEQAPERQRSGEQIIARVLSIILSLFRIPSSW
jgi:hypothetical protein